jgi:hypothetical protein
VVVKASATDYDTEWKPAVLSVADGITGAHPLKNAVAISQSDYDALATPDANTLFLII